MIELYVKRDKTAEEEEPEAVETESEDDGGLQGRPKYPPPLFFF